MHYVNGDFSLGKGFDSLSEAHLLWKRSKPPKDPTRYNLTRFAITMNELIPGLKVCVDLLCSNEKQQLYEVSANIICSYPQQKTLYRFFTHSLQSWMTLVLISLHLQDKLPPTDSRLRPDQRCLENGEYDRANSEKLRLEERQRQVKSLQPFYLFWLKVEVMSRLGNERRFVCPCLLIYF